MKACPRCGTPPPDAALHCPACGHALRSAPEVGKSPQRAVPALLAKTMIGVGTDLANLADLAKVAKVPASPPTPTPEVRAQDNSQHENDPLHQKTMLGMTSRGITPSDGGGRPLVSPKPEARGLLHKKTMLGVAMPGIAPLAPEIRKEDDPLAQVGQPSPQALPNTLASASYTGTTPAGSPPGLYGGNIAAAPPYAATYPAAGQPGPYPVGPPGAAPPGAAPPGAAPPGAAPQPSGYPSPYLPSPPNWSGAGPSDPPPGGQFASKAPERARGHLPAMVAISGALFLGVGAGVFAWFWHSPAPLRGEPIVDDKGRDALRVVCASCPDDTVLTVDPSSVVVRNHSADLVLPSPMQVGDNRIAVRVDRPGRGRDETIDLIVPIAYRIRPDLSGLASDSPSVRLQVETSARTSVTIDGRPITVGTDGHGAFDIDLTRECTGPADEPAVIDKRIAYATDTQGAVTKDTVPLRLAIPALHLDVPNANVVVESEQIPLSGRTSRGAEVSVLGRKVAASQDGSFAGSIQVPLGVSEISVRAAAPDQAPRIVHLSVKRVARLSEEARDFASRAKLSVAAMAQHPNENAGQLVFFSGEVLEARTQNNASVALVDLGRTCPSPPCLARVLIAPSERLNRSDLLRVYGRVVRGFHPTGQAAAPPPSAASDSIPEISADFVLRGR